MRTTTFLEVGDTCAPSGTIRAMPKARGTSEQKCLFCAIAAGEAEASLVYQDETAVAFMLGALIPLLVTFLAPVAVETSVILVTVVASLSLTSVVAARLGHLSAVRMLVRSLVVGLGTMAISYVAGLFFF